MEGRNISWDGSTNEEDTKKSTEKEDTKKSTENQKEWSEEEFFLSYTMILLNVEKDLSHL